MCRCLFYKQSIFSNVEIRNIINHSSLVSTDIDLISYSTQGDRLNHPVFDNCGGMLNSLKNVIVNGKSLEGKSLRLLRPQRLSTDIWKITAALEEFFKWVVNVTGVLTDEKSSTFSPCYDDVESLTFGYIFLHSAFLIQIEGEKHWQFYKPPLPTDILNSVYSSAASCNISTLHPFFSQNIRSGDFVYFPRGVVHCCTNIASSTHLAFTTAHHNNWGDFLIELLRIGTLGALAGSLAMKKSIPRDLGSFMGHVGSNLTRNSILQTKKRSFQEAIVHVYLQLFFWNTLDVSELCNGFTF